MRNLIGTLGAFCLLLAAPSAFAQKIDGEYVESRSADVYTGPCFANGEVGLTGNEATMAWHVRKGAWEGIDLDGLSVVAVTRASTTLGDPYHNPFPAVSILIIDDRANEEQAVALAAMTRAFGGQLLENVTKVVRAPILMQAGSGRDHGNVYLKAGDLATIRTRSLSDKDHYCGNEETYYPPLTTLSHAMPAVALANEFTGDGLGSQWKIYNKRSAFVGTFAFDAGAAISTH